MTKGIVTNTDNRDPTTTILTVVAQTAKGEILEVEINPVDLFQSMLENHPGWAKLKPDWDAFLFRIDEEAGG